MKLISFALSLILAGAFANAETVRAKEGTRARVLEPLEPRDESARLVSKSERVIRKPDGERVVVTRHVYENPAGVRTVRETRHPADAAPDAPREGD